MKARILGDEPPIGRAAEKRLQDYFSTANWSCQDLLERLPISHVLSVHPSSNIGESGQAILAGIRENEEKYARDTVNLLGNRLIDLGQYRYERNRIMKEASPTAVPLSDCLYYEYDQGDEWRVQITCVEEYRTTDRWNLPPDKISYSGFPPGAVLVATENEEIAEDQTVYNSAGEHVIGNMREIVAECVPTMRPICFAADGLPVLDDVGGLAGYCSFLEGIHETDENKKVELKDWAAQRGWNGRKQKPSAIL